MLHASRPRILSQCCCLAEVLRPFCRQRHSIYSRLQTCGMMKTLHTRCRSGSIIVVRPQLFECVENLYKKKKKKKNKYRTEFQHKILPLQTVTAPLPRIFTHPNIVAITSRGMLLLPHVEVHPWGMLLLPHVEVHPWGRNLMKRANQSSCAQPAWYGYHLEKCKKVEKERCDRLTCRSKLERPPIGHHAHCSRTFVPPNNQLPLVHVLSQLPSRSPLPLTV